MKYFSRIFAPTNNRRLNELIGFLLCVSALLLFLALASYSPLDPSLNSASILTDSRAARNWIGVVGALVSDLMLQFFGIGAFLIPIFSVGLGMRWFRSRKIVSPIAKSLGAIWLAVFLPALLALLPGQIRWLQVIPIEGLLGRIVGDVLIHYFNLAGAYIVCATVLAVALYLSTAFSFAALQLWAPPFCFCGCTLAEMERLEGSSRQTKNAAGSGEASSRPPRSECATGFRQR